MRTISIRDAAHLSGRFDKEQTGFPMMWTGACAELTARASTLEVQITCDYKQYNPYLSFTVDGLRAQTFAPLRGTHWYSIFLGMDKTVAHGVRIALETQAFSADPASYVELLSLRTDGVCEPSPARKLRVEFIGDSITSAEGLRGPKAFMEWVPMMFGASDSYSRMVADKLHADVQVVSQSGWGVVCSWDNNPRFTLPSVYDFICKPAALKSVDGTAHGGERPYDFSFDPDAIVVNLGTNDASALNQSAYVDPKTGASFKLTLEDAPTFEEAAYRFILHLHEKNPRARILWLYGLISGVLAPYLERAVSRAKADGVDATYLPLPDVDCIRNGVGSRQHPGVGAHRKMADIVCAELRKK